MPKLAVAGAPSTGGGSPAMTVEPAGVALLRCPRCGKSLMIARNGAVRCRGCRTAVSTDDGIIDFVAGTSVTALDDIDYDQFYAISLASSLTLYETIRTSAGRYWPKSLGNAVEIGCGTGGFSMAILSQSAAEQVVLTDISTKMLRLCRARLNRLGNVHANGVTFATYSGTEDCLAPEAFDTCYGTSVVHHIIDVPSFLGHAHRLLKPGGRAFFMEPNLHFHRALTSTLAGILAEWVRHPVVPEQQMSEMLNWMAEVHCNIVNTGEIEVLAGREDKHQFTAETFEAMAEAAGFASAVSLPCGADPTGWNTIRVYLGQCHVSETTFDLLRQRWTSAQRPHFSVLPARDLSPSYLFWLTKGVRRKSPRRRPTGSRTPVAPVPATATRSPGLLWLELGMRPDGDRRAFTVNGWCVAVARVKSVEITVDGARCRLPIWRPRPDVQAAVNTDNTYPPLHALCSGIAATIELRSYVAGAVPVAVKIDVVTVDGRMIPAGTVALVPGGRSEVLSTPFAVEE